MSKESGDFDRKYNERRAVEKLREVPSPLAVSGAILGGVLGAAGGSPFLAIGGVILGGVVGQVADRREASKLEEKQRKINSEQKI